MRDRKHNYKKQIVGGYTVLDFKPPYINPATGKLEKHNVIALANYEGPGTDLKGRLARGVRPTSNTDAAAKQHDIDYSNIGTRYKKGQINQAQMKAAVRAADNKLLAVARANKSSLNPFERAASIGARVGIGGKNALEDLGLLNEEKFIDPKNADDNEIPEGAGIKKRKRKPKKKKDPAKKLREMFEKKAKI